MSDRDNATLVFVLGIAGLAIYYFYRQSLDAMVSLPGSGAGGAPVTATAAATAPATTAAAAPTFATRAPATGIGAVLENAYNQVFPMQISATGIAFIQQEEGGLRLTSYPDAGGYSIGYGHSIRASDLTNYGIPNEAGVTITEAMANQLFSDDILRTENIINQNVTAVLSQNQFDALMDFVFNVGGGNPNASPPIPGFLTSTLLRDLNAGNYAGAAAQFVRWNQSQGQIKTSLTTRRLAESTLFQTA